MCREKRQWRRLKRVALRWLKTGLKHVPRERTRHTPDRNLDFCVAESLLLHAKEFTETAFEAFRAGRYYSGLSCCRTIFEMAIKLRWCCLKKGTDRHDRYRSWVRETLKSEKRIRETFAKTAPEQYHAGFQGAAERLDADIQGLGDIERLPVFRLIYEEVAASAPDPKDAQFVRAALYEQLCKSVHAELDPDRYSDLVDGTESRRARPKKPFDPEWGALCSIFWLVVSVHEALGWPTKHLGNDLNHALLAIRQTARNS